MLGSEPCSCIGIHVGMSWAWAPIVGTCNERKGNRYYGEKKRTGNTLWILDTIFWGKKKTKTFYQAAAGTWEATYHKTLVCMLRTTARKSILGLAWLSSTDCEHVALLFGLTDLT